MTLARRQLPDAADQARRRQAEEGTEQHERDATINQAPIGKSSSRQLASMPDVDQRAPHAGPAVPDVLA